METSTLRALALLVLAAACDGPRPAPVGARPAAEPKVALERDPLPLAERLAHEAGDHPEARARVERTLLEIAAGEVPFSRTRQALARPLGAAYCQIAVTQVGLGISLCAFATEAQAQRGRALSQRQFDALVPGRRLLVRGSELLTLTQPASEAAAQQAERLARRFTEPFVRAAL